jgi:hypothetical protein
MTDAGAEIFLTHVYRHAEVARNSSIKSAVSLFVHLPSREIDLDLLRIGHCWCLVSWLIPRSGKSRGRGEGEIEAGRGDHGGERRGKRRDRTVDTERGEEREKRRGERVYERLLSLSRGASEWDSESSRSIEWSRLTPWTMVRTQFSLVWRSWNLSRRREGGMVRAEEHRRGRGEGGLELDRIIGRSGEHHKIAVLNRRELRIVSVWLRVSWGRGMPMASVEMVRVQQSRLHVDAPQRAEGDRVEGCGRVFGKEEMKRLAIHGEVEALPSLKEWFQEVFVSQLALQRTHPLHTQQRPPAPRAARDPTGDADIKDSSVGEARSLGCAISGSLPADRSEDELRRALPAPEHECLLLSQLVDVTADLPHTDHREKGWGRQVGRGERER